jgi:hypothetical protein
VALWLAALVAASLACAQPPRRATLQSPAATTVTSEVAPQATETLPVETILQPSPTVAVTATQPPAPAATETAPPTATRPTADTPTPSPQADTQGDQLENLLNQLEGTNTAAESELNELSQEP